MPHFKNMRAAYQEPCVQANSESIDFRLASKLFTGEQKGSEDPRDAENAEMDDLVRSISDLAKGAQKLARKAERQYSDEVEAILKARICDSRSIERCLDGMLDFCFDQGMLVLYRKLCRYYFAIDPEATASYVRAYRDMWDEKDGKSGGGHD